MAATAQSPAVTQAAPALIVIPAGNLAQALDTFAQQSGWQLDFPRETARALNTNGYRGSAPAGQVLEELLRGTSLRVVRRQGSSVVIAADTPGTVDSADATPELRVDSTGASLTSDPVASEGSGSYAASASSLYKSAQPLQKTPMSVSVLTHQRIQDQGLVTTNQALRALPGVTMTQYGEDSSFSARAYGLSTQVDGVPLTSGSRANIYDTAIYDRIEVVRGPAGTLQGVGSIGGVVNLVRKRPTRTRQFEAELSYGTWQNAHVSFDAGGPLNASGSVRGRIVAAAQDRDYFYDYVHNRSRTIYGVLEFDLGEHTVLGVNASYSDSHRRGQYYGIPQQLTRLVSRSTYPGVEWTGADRLAREVGVNLDHTFGNDWKASVRVLRRESVFDYRYLVPLGSPTTPTSYVPFLAYRPQGTDTNLGLDASFNGPLHLFGREHSLSLGLNYDQSHTRYGTPSSVVFGSAIHPNVSARVLGASTDDTLYRTRQWAPYMQGQFSLSDHLLLSLGGRSTRYINTYRYDRPSGVTPPSEYGKANGRFTPYGGLSWEFAPKANWYVSYSDIFNPQTTKSYEGVPFPPVLVWQAETGFKTSLLNDAVQASVAVYRIRERNRAMPDPNPAHVNCGYTGGTCYVASGLVQSQGLDAELSGSPLRNLELQLSYTYNRSKYLSDAYYAAGRAYVTSSPHNLLKFWGTYRFGAEIAGQPRWSIGGGVQAQSSMHFDSGRLYGQSGYAIASLQLGFQPSANTELTLRANNLFDHVYLDSVGPFNHYGEPRNLMLTLRARFK